MSQKPKTFIARRVIGLSAGLLLSSCALQPAATNVPGATSAGAANVVQSANLEMARAAFRNGSYGIALNHLERELALRPDSVSALNGLGATYDQLGRFDVAQRYYFRALALAADPTTTLANLGYSNYLQGKSAEAAKILQLALSLDPGNEVASANMQQVTRQQSAQAGAAEFPAAPVTAEDAADAATPVAVTPVAVTPVATPVAAPPVATLPAGATALRVEISNGSGVSGMAARVRSILQEQSSLRATGGDVVRLTNADHFNYTSTTVFYRSGLASAAAGLINNLPLQDLRFEESDQLAPGVDVRVLLGTDYIAHDTRG